MPVRRLVGFDRVGISSRPLGRRGLARPDLRVKQDTGGSSHPANGKRRERKGADPVFSSLPSRTASASAVRATGTNIIRGFGSIAST